ncbi:hypothetical protein A2715_05860 [Candidatus Woesebacteria bacterium RIFCSPHIGHO2_01_FULL_39_32]|uniref:Uncharacterized protein n=2 Tax=Candidatus Woeseibacteriota TaxID=1752722 RepID=A0A0G0S2M0_9BACT|nr:MAG: hypothetical protein UT61_C0038G0006 [Candidatus Woesebacteria bacterium GW2011_GWA1_39_8]OGM05580.1 MAG: hypothetical protein A2124_00185 [Candidatus Woesebacteria bacterium GWB1_37_5]OGM25542.1 MAG: hypothetical protein A2715_05860 [Candidatus Woesebacteria bacterium RIFCSPHIGHO2_01_FULL_39_32]OGM36822.1 MAG: hypothetical protein A3F01_00335 [Candidatus Woesebacteria bacterium RIFCSPHIGHO2_12_FULL_38_11]OGM65073.1 MAG: hypothetical protein A2893_05470 [Candidatus Woesebacteria bacteri
MTEKVVGYIYIIAGTILMVLALVSVYMVFTKKMVPVNIFSLPGISIDLSSVAPEVPKELQETQGEAASGLQTDLVAPEIINAPLNLIAHIILMGFVLNVGFKIASLGVQLVRPIKVNLRGEQKSVLEP